MEHNLSDSGVSSKLSKTEAIQNLNLPKSLKQLILFLASIYQMAKFIIHAESLTDKLRPPLREENQKQKFEKMKLSVQKVRVGGYHK